MKFKIKICDTLMRMTLPKEKLVTKKQKQCNFPNQDVKCSREDTIGKWSKSKLWSEAKCRENTTR